jgi:hypothetical protein
MAIVHSMATFLSVAFDDLTKEFSLTSSLDYADQPKQHDCAYYSHDQASEQTVGDDPDQSKKKASQQRTQDPYDQISEEAEAASFRDLARKPAREYPYEYDPNQV